MGSAESLGKNGSIPSESATVAAGEHIAGDGQSLNDSDTSDGRSRPGKGQSKVKAQAVADKIAAVFDRGDLKPRALAGLIDGAIACGIVFIFSVIGFFVRGSQIIAVMMFLGAISGGLFILLKDGIYYSSSPGKKLAGLKVVTRSGHFINIAESSSRNFPLALPFFALGGYFLSTLLIPYVGDFIAWPGYLAVPLAAVVALGDVLHMLLDREHSMRWGETSSDTMVVDGD